jgi:hypothetical protein
MGMNYYHHSNRCKCCNRSDVTHIGKSSFGWAFSFQATDKIKSYKDWLAEFGKGGEIRDENDANIPIEVFMDMVKAKQGGKNHAVEYPDGNFLDPEGYSFSNYEFS